MGLCAFRLGMINEAHQALVEICTSGKLRYLIGQGISKTANEREERRRLMPQH